MRFNCGAVASGIFPTAAAKDTHSANRGRHIDRIDFFTARSSRITNSGVGFVPASSSRAATLSANALNVFPYLFVKLEEASLSSM